MARAHRPVGEAQLRAVAGDRRQLQRLEEQVELGERPPADEGERAAGALGQPLERDGQVGRNHHFERCRREVEDGPVDVEQHGARWKGGGVDVQFALPIATLMIIRMRNAEQAWHRARRIAHDQRQIAR